MPKTMLSKFLFLLTFIILGIFIHWLPNRGIPLHSDVTWIYRLQVNKNQKLQQAIPYGLKILGAYKQNFFQYITSWYQLTGRWHFIVLASLRLFASVAYDNADMWRFFYIVILGSSVGLFYLIGRRLKISNPVLIFLSLGLFFSPLDVWTDHKTAEPLALLFLLLAVYIALISQKFWGTFLSAVFMTLSVLSKENFAIYWLLIFVIIYSKFDLKKARDWKGFFLNFVPHLLFIFLLTLFVLYLKINYPLKNIGYITVNDRSYLSLTSFIISYLDQLVPGLTIKNGSLIIILTAILVFLKKFPRLYLNKNL